MAEGCVWLRFRIFKNAAGQGPSDAQLEAILDRSAMLAQMAEKAGQQQGQEAGQQATAGTSAAGVYWCNAPIWAKLCRPGPWPPEDACACKYRLRWCHQHVCACKCLDHTASHC
jgi:hypothetical protein